MGENLPVHAHPNMESRIVFLGGRMLFTRDARTIPLGFTKILRSFVVKAGQAHGAIVTGRFGMFLNLEKWLIKPTSAAHDFIRV